jgi:hypothetical protein
MTYRLIAADLDGTLRASQQSFTPRVRAAVRQAQARGVRVVMATGRMFQTAEPFARELGLTDPIICDHGATICDLQTNALLFQKRISLDLVRMVIESVPEYVAVTVCLDGELFTSRVNEDALQGAGQYVREHLHEVGNLMETVQREPQKLFCGADPDSSSHLLGDMTTRFGDVLQVVQSNPQYVELTHRDASKGNAVAWLARRWGIAREQVLAMGDQHNDHSMIGWAGLGVAMGNAIPSVKAIADFIAPSAAEDGAAVAIERFVLVDE